MKHIKIIIDQGLISEVFTDIDEEIEVIVLDQDIVDDGYEADDTIEAIVKNTETVRSDKKYHTIMVYEP